MSGKTIVVCGATGNQGRNVVASLLTSSRWEVVALSRNPEGAAARTLAARGAYVVRADLLDKASLVKAFQGAYGVFGVTQPWSPDYRRCDVRAEVQQGKNIIDACVDAKVEHLVHSTVLILKGLKGVVPHADSKFEIEDYARATKIPLTIVRPGQFMDNIGTSIFPVRSSIFPFKRASVKSFVAGDAKVPFVACTDIGALVATAFERPAELVGKEMNAVGDFICGDEIAVILSKLRKGEPFVYKVFPPPFILWLFARDIYRMKQVFDANGRPPYPTEITEHLKTMRRFGVEPTTMEKFLQAKGYATPFLTDSAAATG